MPPATPSSCPSASESFRGPTLQVLADWPCRQWVRQPIACSPDRADPDCIDLGGVNGRHSTPPGSRSELTAGPCSNSLNDVWASRSARQSLVRQADRHSIRTVPGALESFLAQPLDTRPQVPAQQLRHPSLFLEPAGPLPWRRLLHGRSGSAGPGFRHTTTPRCWF